MEMLSMLRTIGALGLVLGMLGSALWIVRRYDVKLPGRISNGVRKRVELVERLPVDGKRSVALIRRDGCEHLILIGPEGNLTIETGIAAPATPEPVASDAALPTIEADLAVLKTTLGSSFGKLVEKANAGKLIGQAGVARLVEAGSKAKMVDLQRLRMRAATRKPAPVPAAIAPVAQQPAQRTRRPRDTARWNRAAVRDALNA